MKSLLFAQSVERNILSPQILRTSTLGTREPWCKTPSPTFLPMRGKCSSRASVPSVGTNFLASNRHFFLWLGRRVPGPGRGVFCFFGSSVKFLHIYTAKCINIFFPKPLDFWREWVYNLDIEKRKETSKCIHIGLK